MSHNNSYPSPSAAQVGEGAGPFYAAQQAQRVPPHEELELSAQLSREIGPGNNQGVNDGQGMQQHVDQKFSQPIYPPHPMQSYPQMNATPQGAAGRGFLPDPSNGDDSSARKKSKVSRACDECRRKKVIIDKQKETRLTVSSFANFCRSVAMLNPMLQDIQNARTVCVLNRPASLVDSR